MSDILDDYSSLEWDEDEEEEEEYFDEEGYVPADDWMDESWVDESDEEASKREKRRRRAAAARKARRRRQLAAARKKRRRGPVRKARTPRTAKAAISKTRQDLKEVALENEVRDGAIGGALGSLNKRAGGLESAAAYTPAIRLAQNRIDQFLPGLDQGAQDLVRDALEYAPTLFLKAGKKQLFGLGAGALVLIGAELSKRLQDDNGNELTIDRTFGDIPVGQMLKLHTNKNGAVVWTSADATIAEVGAKGVVTGKKAGSTTITATLGDDVDVVPVTVTGGSSHSSSK